MKDKRFTLEQQRLEFEREKKYQKDIIFYLQPIDPSLPPLQQQKNARSQRCNQDILQLRLLVFNKCFNVLISVVMFLFYLNYYVTF